MPRASRSCQGMTPKGMVRLSSGQPAGARADRIHDWSSSRASTCSWKLICMLSRAVSRRWAGPARICHSGPLRMRVLPHRPAQSIPAAPWCRYWKVLMAELYASILIQLCPRTRYGARSYSSNGHENWKPRAGPRPTYRPFTYIR